MKLHKTEITPLTKEFVYVDYRKQAFLASPFHGKPSFHAHPELELVFIEEGFGKRIIHNKVELFEKGDMVLIGPHVPHVWLSDAAFYDENSNLQSKVIVAYLNPVAFENIFNLLKEFDEIKMLFHDSQKGIKIFGKTQLVIAEQLKAMSAKVGFEKIEILLRIMYLIATSSETEFIGEDGTKIHQSVAKHDRIVEVIKFIDEHFSEHITLKQVSAIACMTEPAFSRFFKSRTQITFSRYVENVRISRSLELLIQSNDSISDISEACGYKCSSHFCKVFKEHTGASPYQYKRGVDTVASAVNPKNGKKKNFSGEVVDE